MAFDYIVYLADGDRTKVFNKVSLFLHVKMIPKIQIGKVF